MRLGNDLPQSPHTQTHGVSTPDSDSTTTRVTIGRFPDRIKVSYHWKGWMTVGMRERIFENFLRKPRDPTAPRVVVGRANLGN